MKAKSPRFTLIELLVVIAIIAILASMLLPVLGRARDTARRSVCVSNEKSMLMALMFYLDEHDEHNPGGSGAHPGNQYAWGHEYIYFVQLAPYMGIDGVTDRPKSADSSGQFAAFAAKIPNNGPVSRSAFRCPASSFGTTDDYATALDPWGNGGLMPWWEFSSYGIFTSGWAGERWDSSCHWWDMPINVFDGSGNITDQTAADFLLGRVVATHPDPVNQGIFGHFARYCVWWQMESATGWAAPSYDFAAMPGHYPGSKSNSHGDTLPAGFFDGHVDAITLRQMLDPDEYGWNGRAPLWRVTYW